MSVRIDVKYAYSNYSSYAIYSDLLGHTYFLPDDLAYEKNFYARKTALINECNKLAKLEDCGKIVENGHAIFCRSTIGFSFCANSMNVEHPAPPPTTTTTTSTTAKATTASPRFPVGTVIGGFMAGAFLGSVIMFLILCFCKRRSSSHPDDPTRKKSKKNKKNGTTTGSFGSTEGSGTTNTTETGTTKKDKKKKKKAKKEKKAKKTEKGKTTTQTNTATAY